ncbi:hypothetical protein [Carboxylicivirga sp. RSCT41]|uniref:hypothetical protein n=1 Tax=Carboxylicivirga agarovorans TaxID=3417570 RepID=UPI003D355CFF
MVYRKIDRKKLEENLGRQGFLDEKQIVVELLRKLFFLDDLAYFYTKSIKNDGVMMKSTRGQKANPAVQALEKCCKEITSILVELANLTND